jgi:uroporphyrinogen decarboxylase
MSTETLSSRERVRLALEHEVTDRVPIALICSGINPPARRALDAYLRRERGIGLDAYLEPLIDVRSVAPAYVGPALDPGEDIWGVRRNPVSYGEGSYDEIVGYPLAEVEDVADLAAHRWPTTAWFDYAVLPERIAAERAWGDPCLMVANGNIFETSWYMRGFERMFMDFVLNPELAHALLERVAGFWIEHFRAMLAAAEGEVDLAFTADDIGGQNGLLMSLDMWETFIKPHHARLNRAIHEFGAKVIYHTDGAVMDAVPGLIDMGIDVLQALQFSARGMDPGVLKREYGDRLCFEGGVSVQTTLPFGSPQDVQREVEDLIRVLGTGGGYILGPSHAIQAGTPPENIVALFDTAACYYPFTG